MAHHDLPYGPERHPRDVLREHGIRPRKGLGQNFLVAGRNLDRIVEAAGICADEAVLEIGTGLGRLTARIAERAARAVSVEIDRALHELAVENLRAFANVVLLCGDFLQSKHRINPAATKAVKDATGGRAQPLKVVSNLPYSISSPAIVNLLEWDVPPGEMYVMLQKEVADRLTARPGTREYGPLTVFVDYWASVERLFSIPRRCFWPAPEVSSSLVKISRRPQRQRTEEYATFSTVVRKLFAARRKTLASALRGGWGRETSQEVPERLGMDPRTRAENLATADFEAIASLIGQRAQD